MSVHMEQHEPYTNGRYRRKIFPDGFLLLAREVRDILAHAHSLGGLVGHFARHLKCVVTSTCHNCEARKLPPRELKVSALGAGALALRRVAPQVAAAAGLRLRGEGPGDPRKWRANSRG